MRNCFMLMIAFLAAACPQTQGPGDDCGLFGAGACMDDLRCVNGTCVPCGADGEVCCSTLGEECDSDTMACLDGNDGHGVCEGDCGKVGEMCCEGDDPCPFSGTCQLGTCTALGVDDDCHDPNGQSYTVHVIDAECLPHLYTFQTATAGKAEECRQELPSNDVEVCPLGVEPYKKKTCSSHLGAPNEEHVFEYCSDAWFQACKSVVCFDCEWTDVDDLEDFCPLVQ